MDPRKRTPARRLGYENRLTAIVVVCLLPLVAAVLLFLVFGDFSAKLVWTVAVVMAAWLAMAILILRSEIVYPLRTLANLLAALREEDFSIRARGARADEALGEVLVEVNQLGTTLREQRLQALEATALVRAVIAEIDVAIFAFDRDQRLQLINRAGERLLGSHEQRLLGKAADELGLADSLGIDGYSSVDASFPGGSGRWSVRRTRFREKGLTHQLLVIADLSRALREEERQAWKRLVRVLGHELNNSLAPIKSIASSLEAILASEPLPPDWKDDMDQGLGVITSRAESLTRFMEAYARLARLPRPNLRPVDLHALVRRVVGLEHRARVEVVSGPPIVVSADSDQLEQLLINVVRNAVDAALESRGRVSISWAKRRSAVEVIVSDEGPGLSGTTNLFVPFFTTKPGGTGIGLVLSRQIAEAHGGSLVLQNRTGGRGCEARLELPLG
ncbi:MAG TPA: ATP-binding protein [Thermoanaerobaculia bacterium]|nr:ATP-binding protein [Thermoanaerobaculia bacterium]